MTPRATRIGFAGLLLAAACTSTPTPTTATSSPPTSSPPIAGSESPLAIATTALRPQIHIARATADALIAGRISDWESLGEPAHALTVILGPAASGGTTTSPAPHVTLASTDDGAISALAEAPNAVAVVLAESLRPSVRAIAVDGRHPLREPETYPVKARGSPPSGVTTVTLVGDVMLGRRVGAVMARAGDFAAPFRHAADRLARADLTVGTLECTLSRAGPPQQGGDSFGADPRAVEGLRLAGFDVLSLADNHAGDFGPTALVETVRRVRDAGIVPVGAGAEEREARAPAIVERNGVRFGFLAFNAIGETPPAGRAPGAVRLRMQPRLGPLNEDDLERFRTDVRTLRPLVDVLIVLPHWGGQYTTRLHPDQPAVAQALVDAGADLIVGSHPHWVQGMELRKGRPVAYSLGNFVFDMDFSRRTQEGAVLELVFWGSTLKAAEIAPVRIGSDFAPRFLAPKDARPILEEVRRASGPPFNR
jgi:poly-gamma-glutamate synthesis protein (capsule biosynthesis protein)